MTCDLCEHFCASEDDFFFHLEKCHVEIDTTHNNGIGVFWSGYLTASCWCQESGAVMTKSAFLDHLKQHGGLLNHIAELILR